LACAYSKKNETNKALEFLEKAVNADERFREKARYDKDLSVLIKELKYNK
jgi:hypothetical protein